MQKIFQIPKLRRASSCVLCFSFQKYIPLDLSRSSPALMYVIFIAYVNPRDTPNIKARCDKRRRICANFMFLFAGSELSASVVRCSSELPDLIFIVLMCFSSTVGRFQFIIRHNLHESRSKCRPN